MPVYKTYSCQKTVDACLNSLNFDIIKKTVGTCVNMRDCDVIKKGVGTYLISVNWDNIKRYKYMSQIAML